jgi:hypothetical protein
MFNRRMQARKALTNKPVVGGVSRRTSAKDFDPSYISEREGSVAELKAAFHSRLWDT